MSDSHFLTVCPSIDRYNFHGWSAGGRQIAALSLLKGRTNVGEKFLDMIYQCQMCGGCDVSCKIERDLEPYEVMQQLRIMCIERGDIIPEHLLFIDGLKKEDNMMMESKEKRGDWAEGLNVKVLTKEHADVLFHAGCRYSFDHELWSTCRSALTILLNAGVDIGILGKEETCCGGRSYEMGYASELMKYAEHNTDTWKAAGVKTVVTPCADCYQAFKVLYSKTGQKHAVEVLHITEFIDRLMKEGKIRLTKRVPLTVTYHDPCHLGRLAEPWVHWEGKKVKVNGQMVVHDPPKKKRCGANGVYEAPRDILRKIPGLNFVEMHRIREYAWCCGAGGGVKEAYPDFAEWTAARRLEEAAVVGAKALVSACPWCKRNFIDATPNTDARVEVYDIIELVEQAI
jgi:Fe-S oxidoreductase